MRRANSRLVAPQSASVGQYFRVAAVDANGVVTAVEAVDAPKGGDTVTDEQITQAVSDYMAENPVEGGKGEPGEPGADGKDGFSPTVTVGQTENGAVITITDKNGTTTATVANGKDGADGQDGHTPMKGVDYFDGKDAFNPLADKIAVFDGDSICAAGTDKPDLLGAYAGRIGSNNGMTVHNYAVGGGTITAEQYSSSGVARHWVSRSIDAIYAAHPTLDFLILEGGTNDADIIGDITSGDTPAKFGAYDVDDYSGSYDDTTFCGAVETLFFKALSYYPGTKIGVVIPMQMGNSKSASRNRRAYFDVLIELCRKWAIPYLDLWRTSQMNANLTVYYDPSLSVAENTAQKYYQDGQHPTSKGYDLLAPRIEAWLRTMTAVPEYEENPEVPSTPAYTNLVPTSIDTDGSVFDGTGYKDGVYLSGGNPTGSDAAITTTGFIPWTKNADGTVSPIYVKGATLDSAVSHCRLYTYGGADKDYAMQMKQEGNSGTYAWGTHFTYETLGDQYYKITALSVDQVNAYVRLSLKGSGANLIVTVGEPIE